MLRPTAHLLTSQELFVNNTERLRDVCWARGNGTGWTDRSREVQARALQNLLCQLNSLQEVGDLWLRHAAAARLQYRAVVYLRPDVLYTDPLPVAAITNISEGAVAIPDWGHFGGINDRFAALGPRSAAKWKERLAYTLQHCVERPVHAETFARSFGVDHDLDVLLLQNFLFFRVRSDGSIPGGDSTPEQLPRLPRAREMIQQRHEELRAAEEASAGRA